MCIYLSLYMWVYFWVVVFWCVIVQQQTVCLMWTQVLWFCVFVSAAVISVTFGHVSSRFNALSGFKDFTKYYTIYTHIRVDHSQAQQITTAPNDIYLMFVHRTAAAAAHQCHAATDGSVWSLWQWCRWLPVFRVFGQNIKQHPRGDRWCDARRRPAFKWMPQCGYWYEMCEQWDVISADKKDKTLERCQRLFAGLCIQPLFLLIVLPLRNTHSSPHTHIFF